MPSKNIIVFTEHSRHMAVETIFSIRHRFRHHAVKAIEKALGAFAREDMMIAGLDEVVTIDVDGLTWTDLPHLPENCFGHRNSFNPAMPADSDEFKHTWGPRSGVDLAVGADEMGEIVLVGWATMHVGKALARLSSFMTSMGHRPDRVLVVRANFAGQNHQWIEWDAVMAEAERWLPMLRFEALYNLNFRGLALKAMRHCIVSCAGPDEEQLDFRMRRLAVVNFRPAFVPVLEMVGRMIPVPADPLAVRRKPGLMVWQAASRGDDRWLLRAEEARVRNMKADHSKNASVQSLPPIAYWTGSGSLPPISGDAFSLSSYPGEYLASSWAYILGFVSLSEGSPRLTRSGRMFLDMLPTKAKDIDAPIRWHDLRPEDAGRADEWLERHFRLIKRAMNERAAQFF